MSDTSITEPSAPYLGTVIQSPTLSMSFAESWMPETKPRMLSRKTSMMTAAEAPSPVSRMAGDLPIRIETMRIPQISAAIPLPGLAQSVDRFVLPRRTRRDDIEGRIKQGVDKTEDRDDDVHLYQSCDDRPGFRLFIENHGEDDDQHDGADDITQPAQHGGTEQFVIPRGFGAHHDAPNPAHEHRTAQEIEKHDGQHHQGESHPTIPAVIQCGSEPEPCEQGVGPT